jgi:hypothetical protein
LGELEDKLKKGITQDITVLDINAKHDTEWRNLFNSFGLEVFFETDLDSAWKFYPSEAQTTLNTPQLASQFLTNHPDAIAKIEDEYPNNTFILKEGDLESYLGIQKGLDHVISFCRNDLKNFLTQTSTKVNEIKMILSKVTGEPESDL